MGNQKEIFCEEKSRACSKEIIRDHFPSKIATMIVIIDYGMGNIGSIMNMIKKAGGESTFTSDHTIIREAEKLILPGVGSFDNGMKNLADKKLIDVLNQKVLGEKTKVLGICLGMQLMSAKSEEGQLSGLGWLDAETVRFQFSSGDSDLRIPHMGWNSICLKKEHFLFQNMPEDPSFYFVHSYHIVCHDNTDVLCTTPYGGDFVSAASRDNIMATQFHPEKSHKYGLQLIRNFVEC
jgi:imidazole glycerol-phosphate synthase subunit HisH